MVYALGYCFLKARAMPEPQEPWVLQAWRSKVCGGAVKREPVWWVRERVVEVVEGRVGGRSL